jgi:tetratricopeptide (TPR) repeat protein
MGFASILLFVASGLSAGKPSELEQAREFYQHTEYRASLKILLSESAKNPQVLQLIGQDYFMLGDYKKATDALEKAISLGETGPDPYLWLGRAYGRRAETAGPFTAPGYASHARKMFEKAVEVDISNREAAGDLLDYYLNAPAFLGGGMNKAEELAKKVSSVDPPEGQYLMAQIEDKRKRFDAAEQHLRRAVEMAPRQVSRLVPLALHLAKHGRTKESDAVFAEAASIEPRNPRVVFYRAETYVESQRNLEDARKLLREYVALPLTPEDPPRETAQGLLAKIQP